MPGDGAAGRKELEGGDCCPSSFNGLSKASFTPWLVAIGRLVLKTGLISESATCTDQTEAGTLRVPAAISSILSRVMRLCGTSGAPQASSVSEARVASSLVVMPIGFAKTRPTALPVGVRACAGLRRVYLAREGNR